MTASRRLGDNVAKQSRQSGDTKLPIAHKLARAPRLTAPLPRRYEAPQRPFHRMNMDRIAGQLRAAAAGHAFSVADRRQVDIPTTGAALQRARCAGIPRSGDLRGTTGSAGSPPEMRSKFAPRVSALNRVRRTSASVARRMRNTHSVDS